eukprot:GAHX01002653.1.p1 GENE.GAHX01002653.1~~GAHX01002653.1.p1  ORF type:complete len:74 (-),score=0.55 GAHX01002653.1:612-833(-)
MILYLGFVNFFYFKVFFCNSEPCRKGLILNKRSKRLLESLKSHICCPYINPCAPFLYLSYRYSVSVFRVKGNN